MGYAEDLLWAEQNLAAASAYHANAVNATFAAMQQAEQGYWERIRALEELVAEAEDVFVNGLSTYEGITLYPDRVSDGETTAPLVRGVHSTVTTAGSKPSSGPDTRTLSITIDFPNGMRITAMGDPDEEGAARAFAALVMNTAAKTGGAGPSEAEEFARLERELARARADTRELDAARAAYETAYYDTAAVWAAQRHLDDVLARTPEEELAAIEDARQSRLLRHRVIAIVTTLVLVVLGIAFVVIFSWALL
ncbi:hypothetical protein [Arabiibacter massiliensis]|uniref:hypothetical protein n=1 Tax=Arabiibacter massiliensis TaxID=1870985 RepID=UPI0009BC5EE6|nr:hypothetical protein [Arabiibacter massiliensis]